jgi:hypothetical protein
MKEIVMNKLQRVTLAVASAAAVGAAGLGVAAATANTQPAAASQAAPASSLGGGQVKANERVVEAFLQDVINEHNGNDVALRLVLLLGIAIFNGRRSRSGAGGSRSLGSTHGCGR